MSNSTFPTFNALSSSQTEMDGERDLQRNLFNGSKMRRTGSLQYVFPSFQNQQRNPPRRSRSTPNFSVKYARVYDDNDKYGLFTLSIYEGFSSKQKEEKEDKEAQNEKVYEAKDIFTQTLGTDCKLDKHLTTHRPKGHVPENYKRLLESQSQKNNRIIIRSINSGKTPTQKTYDHVSTEDRSGQFPSTYPSSKSESGRDVKERALGSWQLFRNEHVDSS
ncbi:6457_t:CDS:2, partial [Funneliformis caledonium]